jgi:hypothetical protein
MALCAVAVLCACTKHADYPYLSGFSLYMKQVHQITITEGEQLYYVMPIDSCEPCVVQNLEMLQKLSPIAKLRPIWVGKSGDKGISEKVSILQKQYPLSLIDAQNSVFQYETGLGKPVLLHLKNGNSIYYLYVTNDIIEKASDYLKRIE